MTYRIKNQNGYIDFAADIETAKRKLEIYKSLVDEGYSKYVKIVAIDFAYREIEIE